MSCLVPDRPPSVLVVAGGPTKLEMYNYLEGLVYCTLITKIFEM